MLEKFVNIDTIADLHHYYNYGSPRHPLITIIDLKAVKTRNRGVEDAFYRLGLYTVVFKKFKGELRYGRSTYDFQDGSLMFAAPNQVLSPSENTVIEEGWFLAFHPDLLYGSLLGKNIGSYSFFRYNVNEALHISDGERKTLEESIQKIAVEYSQNMDKHTQGLIVSNLELMLQYCDRFYNRQFLTRSKVNNDFIQQFEDLLQNYFEADDLADKGLPEVKYFAEKLNLSANYLSDLLNKYTGKTTIEHIHLQLVEKAKSILWGTNKSVSEIAYSLGFDHPSHFSKIFKMKTGKSPKNFRIAK